MPRFRAPSADTRSVSGDTSMWTPSASAETTVRQTPLTATESPGLTSSDRGVVTRSRNPAGVGLTSATSPSVSTIPVNMFLYPALDQHVLAEPGGAAIQ